MLGSGLLAGAVDPDGDAIVAVLVTGTAHGNVLLDASGSFVYTPETNFNGTVSFAYRLTDGSLSSDPIIVTIESTLPMSVPAPTYVVVNQPSTNASSSNEAKLVTTSGSSPVMANSVSGNQAVESNLQSGAFNRPGIISWSGGCNDSSIQ